MTHSPESYKIVNLAVGVYLDDDAEKTTTFHVTGEATIQYSEWNESRGEFWGAPCSERMSEIEVLDVELHEVLDEDGKEVDDEIINEAIIEELKDNADFYNSI
jgi:hypothetical protein